MIDVGVSPRVNHSVARSLRSFLCFSQKSFVRWTASERADDSSVQVMDESTSRNSCRDEIQTSCWEIEDRLGLLI